ncbi:MAG: (Fe-S)-binding protein [Desulfobacteraceae bacterium]|nr:(Fe-S)-binding protein [Desulfobacteraceae bacterium]
MKNHSETFKTVYYFGTCLADMVYPRAGMCGIKLLQREGIRVIYPQRQTCCGQPAYNSGFPGEAKEVALTQVKLFSGSSAPVIVPSGSCAGMMKYHYPHLFRDDPEYFEVKRFSDRIYELTQYLNRVLHVRYEDKGPPIRLTWHSSCHAMREMECIEDSKALIHQLENVELVELEKEYECCGFGGTFSVKQPEISAAMVHDKAESLRATGTEKFLTGDCGCMMNINGHLEKQGSPIKGQHIAEFILERING